MKKYPFLVLSLMVLCLSGTLHAQKNKPIYQDETRSIDKRVEDLISRMTLEEKVGQTLCMMGWEMYHINTDRTVVEASEKFKKLIDNQYVGMLWATFRADPWTKKTLANGLNPRLTAEAANALQRYVLEHSRLGIPMFFAEEAAHGHMAIGTTVYPTSLGQAATFNPSLIQQMGATIGKEIRLQGAHIAYGPILDLSRDPRWSRVEETYGEDPYLISCMGQAMVKGLGGGDLSQPFSAISTLKHFVAYGSPESGLNGNPSVVGERDLYENFLPPFKAAIDAGALSVMTSYNSIDGVPSTMNKKLLTDVLREDWNFRGYVVSDLFSVDGISGSHRIVPTLQEAAVKALEAGTDVDLGGAAYAKLVDAVKSGAVDESVLNRAVAYVLRLKFEMGLFENPYVDVEAVDDGVSTDNHIELARQIAQQSLVLLKNKDQILPLDKSLKVAVIGPNADNQYNQLGDYTAPQPEESIVTILEGIERKIGAENVTYAKGCAIRDTLNSDITAAVKVASAADVAVVVVGGSSARDFKTSYKATGAAVFSDDSVSDMDCGEGYDRATLSLLGRQMELLQAVKNTGTPMVVIYIQGRPLNMNWANENADALVAAWYPGQEGGNAVADALFGDCNFSGRLPISVPKAVGQVPCYYNKRTPRGHSFVEVDHMPLFSFGYGLSYTEFDYSNLKVEQVGTTTFKISFDVTNSGNYDGEEVAQLYLRDLYASTVRPVKQLKAFKRLFLKKKETKRVEFILDKESLLLYNLEMKPVVEPGDFEFFIGPSSEKVALKGAFNLAL